MTSEYKKELLIKFLVCTLILGPVAAYIIAQFVKGYVHIVSIVVLVIIVGIFIFNIIPRSFLTRGVNKTYRHEESGTHPIEGGVEYRYVKDELTIQMNEQKKRPIGTMVASILLGIAMIGLSLLMYFLVSKKVYDAGATLVDATVINVVDKTTKEVRYEDGEKVVKENQACDVTFSYTLDGENKELTHRFEGMSNIAERQLQIYVKDGKFIATKTEPAWGIVFMVYYIVLALFHFARAFYATDLTTTLVGGLFSSIAGIFILQLKISFNQIFFFNFGAVVLLLTLVGVGVLFADIPTINLFKRKTITFTASVKSK